MSVQTAFECLMIVLGVFNVTMSFGTKGDESRSYLALGTAQLALAIA